MGKRDDRRSKGPQERSVFHLRTVRTGGPVVTARINLTDFYVDHPEWAGSHKVVSTGRQRIVLLRTAAMPAYLRWMVARWCAAPKWAEATYADLRRQRPELFPEPTRYPPGRVPNE